MPRITGEPSCRFPKINIGTLTSSDLSFDTSLARNLNNLGYFTGGVQTVGTGVANLLVNSPPTQDTTGTTPNAYKLTPAAAAVFTTPQSDSGDTTGWNFHDTYFVTLNASKLISIGAVTQNGPGSYSLNPGWSFAPNADELHNSPAKPCPCVANSSQGLDPSYSTSVVNFNGTPAYKLTFNQGLGVNDNMYSSTSPTTFWNGKQHKFSDLTGSDKAEFTVPNPSGGNLFDFFIDYISATSLTSVGGHSVVSGYASLGPNGGDGSWGTQTAPHSALLGWTTTFDDDFNALGYFAGGVQVVSPGAPNLLTDAPPPVSTTDETQGAAAPFAAWNYVDGYTVYLDKATVDAAYPGGFSNANWSAPFQHNSPSKPSTCPTGTPGSPNLSITSKKVDKKQVQIVIKNSGTADAILTELQLSWPALNGNLQQIKLDGDVIFDAGPAGIAGPVDLKVPPLVKDQNKRKINKGQSDTLFLIFKNNADPVLAHYTGTAFFGATTLTILP